MNNSESVNRYMYTTKLQREQSPDIYNLFRRVKIKDESIKSYHKVSEDEVNRLDIIANRHYKDPRLWWLIAIENNIIDPFFIPIGLTLKIPHIVGFYTGEVDSNV